MLSISSHILENLSDPRLFKYTWIRHFLEYQSFNMMGRIHDIWDNFWPQMSYFSLFHLPKDHIQEKFHHYFIFFFIKHKPCVFLVTFNFFFTICNSNKFRNIKTTNLLSRMHYSGPDSPAFSQLNKKALWRHFLQIQTAHTRHRSNLQHAHFIYSNVIK